jgi:hypothetical protein
MHAKFSVRNWGNFICLAEHERRKEEEDSGEKKSLENVPSSALRPTCHPCYVVLGSLKWMRIYGTLP